MVVYLCHCAPVDGCRPTVGKMHCKYNYLSYSQLCYRLEQIGIYIGYAFDIKSSSFLLISYLACFCRPVGLGLFQLLSSMLSYW